MEQAFFFVDGVNADKASKRLMRRHVMKGKNAGKTFHRPSRRGLEMARRQPTSMKIARSICNPLLTFPFPVKVTPAEGKAMYDYFNITADLVYPIQLGFSLQEYKSQWLGLFFSDKASYDCTLALIQASNETILGHGNSSPMALFRLSQTLALFRKRLESKEALSDATIALAISLINQEQVCQHQASAEVHLMGMKRLVDLRGGLENFKESRMLALKICKTDIMFAIQQDSELLFYRDKMEEVKTKLASRHFSLEYSSDACFASHAQLDLAFKNVVFDIMGICTLFNDHLLTQPLDFLDCQEALVSIRYRLLRFRTMGASRQITETQSTYHIGLVVFMITLFLQNNQSRLIRNGLITSCIEHALETGVGETEGGVAFWIMFLGAMWSIRDDDEGWIISRLQGMALEMDLTTWDDARILLKRFPWINAIHDQPGYKLWDQIGLTRLDSRQQV